MFGAPFMLVEDPSWWSWIATPPAAVYLTSWGNPPWARQIFAYNFCYQDDSSWFYGVRGCNSAALASTLARLQPYWTSMGRATACCGLSRWQTTIFAGIGSGITWGLTPIGRQHPAQLGRQYAASYGDLRACSWWSHSSLRGHWHCSIYSNCSSTRFNVNIVNIE